MVLSQVIVRQSEDKRASAGGTPVYYLTTEVAECDEARRMRIDANVTVTSTHPHENAEAVVVLEFNDGKGGWIEATRAPPMLLRGAPGNAIADRAAIRFHAEVSDFGFDSLSLRFGVVARGVDVVVSHGSALVERHGAVRE